MDFSLDQNELGLLCREIVAGHQGGGCFDAELWRELGKSGVLAAALPESAGGDGLGLLEQCSVLTEIGRALVPAPYLASIVLGASAITAFGTPEQQRRWAAPAGRGELLLTVALEPEDPRESPISAERAGAGSGETGSAEANEAGAGTGAEAGNAGVSGAGAGAGGVAAGNAEASGTARVWRVSGVWTGVPAAPWADLILVPVGNEVFAVERGAAGVTVEPQELTDGVTAGRVVLHGAPAERLDGPGASGGHPASWLMERGTVGLCALQLGVTERALELTAAYATSREQFGRPIGSFQAVAQRLADAWIDVAAIRLTMWQAAWRLAAELPADLAVSTAKFWAADAGHRVAHTAVHVHGGVGIDVSHPMHHYFAAATHYEFSLGGATAQLRHIGAELARL